MSMTRGQMRQELKDLGHRYLPDARLSRFLNEAARQQFGEERWRCRYREDTGVLGGGVVADLGPLSQVLIGDQAGWPLAPMTMDEMRDAGFLQQAGAALYYSFKRDTNDQDILVLGPQGTVGQTYTVIHWTVKVWRNGGREAADDSDMLIGNGVFDEAILLGARVRCLEDTDEDGLRDSVQDRLEAKVRELRETELDLNSDEPKRIKQTRPWY